MRIVHISLWFTLFFTSICAQTQNILVLHSYNRGLEWTDSINSGILHVFKDKMYQSIDFREEYMDTKHFRDESYFTSYYKYISQKYQSTSIKLIVCSDDPAFNFLVWYRDTLFPNVPVVFCGVSHTDTLPSGFTGVIENIDIGANLTLITRLHPHYRKLYIINDLSITGKAITGQCKKFIKTKYPNLQHEFLINYTLPELKRKIKSLHRDDIVLLLKYSSDRLGNYYTYEYIFHELISQSEAPFYGVNSAYLGRGIVGGKLNSGYQQGLLAGQMAKEILTGKQPSAIPIDTSLAFFRFDQKMLSKFYISHCNLPDHSTIINSRFEFIAKNKSFFVLLGFVFILSVVCIILLYIQNRKAQYNLKKEYDLVDKIEEKSIQLEIALAKLEESNKLKNAILANISHEIRTPMNGILGFSDLLQDAIPQYNNLEIKEYVRLMHQSGKQLLKIIDDILDISLIESNQIDSSEELILITTAIQEVITSFTNNNPKVAKLIQTNFTHTVTHDFLITDGHKFKLIISNLISNAIKFGNQKPFEIGYTTENNWFTFYIKDQGIGIAPAFHQTIFDTFVQLNQGPSRLYGGNGLGLSIAKAYVELLGGQIGLDSELGHGATFFFSLPLKDSFQIPETKPKQNIPKRSLLDKTVLVVEDDSTSFYLLKLLLEKNIGNLIHVPTGKEAIELIRSKKEIDIILMDIRLPDMDRFQITKIIQRINPHIPIIAQSAFVSHTIIKAAYEAGCVDYITKPIDKNILLRKLEMYSFVQ